MKQVTTMEQKRIKRKVLKVFETGGQDVAKQIREGNDLPVPASLITDCSLDTDL